MCSSQQYDVTFQLGNSRSTEPEDRRLNLFKSNLQYLIPAVMNAMNLIQGSLRRQGSTVLLYRRLNKNMGQREKDKDQLTQDYDIYF